MDKKISNQVVLTKDSIYVITLGAYFEVMINKENRRCVFIDGEAIRRESFDSSGLTRDELIRKAVDFFFPFPSALQPAWNFDCDFAVALGSIDAHEMGELDEKLGNWNPKFEQFINSL